MLRLGVLLEQGGSARSMRLAGQEQRLRRYLSRYREVFDEVLFFSYARDDELSRLPEGVRIVTRRGPLKPSLYSVALPFLAPGELHSCSLLRVLQITATLPAEIARRRFHVGFAVTYGYDVERLADRRPLGGMFSRWSLKLASRGAEVIFCPTRTLEDKLSRFNPHGRIVRLPNGVDLTQFRPAHVRSRPAGRWRVVSAGRLSPEKNYASLIEALAGRDDVELHLFGSGPEESRLAERAAASTTRLVLHGTVATEELAGSLRQADLFVLPSETEGHPKALLEAMASGLACVGSRQADGIRELLSHEDTGLLSDNDSSSLRAAVERLLRDRELATRLGGRARERIERDFDLERILDREMEVLEELARLHHV
jgi:glycosyltransferase involved in cell wall biosynthesis